MVNILKISALIMQHFGVLVFGGVVVLGYTTLARTTNGVFWVSGRWGDS